MKRLFLLLALSGFLGSYGQVKHEIFESFKLQERRAVSYYFPENMDPDKSYPLVIVLDAEYLFDQVVAISKFYAEFQGMPEVIVAGVYQSENEQRWADCAFNEDNGLPTEHAAKFFEFLSMELIAYLDTQFNTSPFKVFVGYGITANFGNYYLFKDRSLFNSIISISPLLAPEMESRIPQRIADLQQPIFYQLIIGGERTDSRNAILQLDRNLESIQRDGFTYDFHEYSAANEISVVPYALGKAWDETFMVTKPISPKDYREEILTYDGPVIEYLEKKYDLIENLFGIRKPMELNDIMAIYAASRKKEDLESLKALADISLKAFPNSMLGFYFEGEYYEQKGEPKKALRAFEKAFGMEEIDFLTKEMALEKMEALKRDFGFR